LVGNSLCYSLRHTGYNTVTESPMQTFSSLCRVKMKNMATAKASSS